MLLLRSHGFSSPLFQCFTVLMEESLFPKSCWYFDCCFMATFHPFTPYLPKKAWHHCIRGFLSFSFSRLKKPNSFSLSSQCASLPTILMEVCWTCSSLSVFLVLGGPNLDVLHIYIPEVNVRILVCLKETKLKTIRNHSCLHPTAYASAISGTRQFTQNCPSPEPHSALSAEPMCWAWRMWAIG